MAEQEEPSSFDDMESRLRAARQREDELSGRERERRPPSPGIALGMRLAVEFAAGIVVGVGLGWALDRWLGTAPWFMVLFLMLGGAAGVMNAYRAAHGLGGTVGLGKAQRERSERTKDT